MKACWIVSAKIDGYWLSSRVCFIRFEALISSLLGSALAYFTLNFVLLGLMLSCLALAVVTRTYLAKSLGGFLVSHVEKDLLGS